VAGNSAGTLFLLNDTRQVRCIPSELAELLPHLAALLKLNGAADLKNEPAFLQAKRGGGNISAAPNQTPIT
jgi:hypothetical protein